MFYWYENNAHIKLCNYDWDLIKNLSRTKDFYDIFRTWSRTDRIVFPTDISNPKDLMDQYSKSLAVGVTGKKIYFHPKSKFPRFKLMGTDYKRTIKLDKCDCIVVPEIPEGWISMYPKMRIYKDKYSNNLFGISKGIYDSRFVDEKHFLECIKLWNNVDLEFVQTTYIAEVNMENSFAIDILLGKYTKPIITDTMLDLEISKSLPTISESDIDSIDSMLNSTDQSVVEMGLKLLTGFNVFETPTIIKTLLYKHWNVVNSNKALNSVAVRKMLNSVDADRKYIGSFPNWAYALAEPGDKFSDYEIAQVGRLLKPLFKEYVEKNSFKLKAPNAPFIPNIKIIVE